MADRVSYLRRGFGSGLPPPTSEIGHGDGAEVRSSEADGAIGGGDGGFDFGRWGADKADGGEAVTLRQPGFREEDGSRRPFGGIDMEHLANEVLKGRKIPR